jgi:HAD-hyrolase-like
VLGKPSRAAVAEVANRLNVPSEDTVVVGDDLDLDVALGRLGGARTILVRTGISGQVELDRLPERRRPDAAIDGVAELLGSLCATHGWQGGSAGPAEPPRSPCHFRPGPTCEVDQPEMLPAAEPLCCSCWWACWDTHLPKALDLLAFVPYLALNAAGSACSSVRHVFWALTVALVWVD